MSRGSPRTHLARRGMARTFQHVKLRPAMTLLDNVALGAYGRTRAGFLRRRACGSIVPRNARCGPKPRGSSREWGLAPNGRSAPARLPLGEQRLLEVARALAADPALVILDEPAAGLAPPGEAGAGELDQGLRTEGVTVMLVEHDMDFVMNLVDRVVVMDFGVKIAEGSPLR